MITTGRFPNRLVALCMVAAPLFTLFASLIGFQGVTDIEGELRFISLHANRFLASNILWLISSLLFIPTAIGLLALVPDRLYGWGLARAALLIIGGFGHGVVISYSMVQTPLLESGLDQDAVSTFIAGGMYEHPSFVVLLVLFLGFYLGLSAFAIVLWRSNVSPWWVTALILIALIVGFVWDHPAKNEVMDGLPTISLGFLGIRCGHVTIYMASNNSTDAMLNKRAVFTTLLRLCHGQRGTAEPDVSVLPFSV